MPKYLLPFFIFLSFFANGQEFLQLETINDPATKKFIIGETIKVKFKDSDDWERIRLTQFLHNDSIIVYQGGFTHIKNIVAIRDSRIEVSILSKMLMTFGATWLVYGSISGEIFKNNPQSGYTDLFIGLTSLGVGYGVHKAFYNRDYMLGKRYRLRLLDMRMYPKEVTP